MKLGDWKVFLFTSIGVMMVFTNMTTMDVTLPSIVRYFNATPAQGSWILLAYMLTNTVMILAFGRLADMLGRKSLYIAGMAVFTLGSLGCGLAWSANALIGFRVLQAVGAASIITNNTALLVDAFPPKRLALVLGLNVTVAAASSISGPLLGGALVSWFGWRVLFLFNVPFGVLSLLFGPTILRSHPRGPKEKFDLAGMLLSCVGLGGLIYALTEGGDQGWASAPVLIAAVCAVVAGTLFIRLQKRLEHPLIDLALLRDRSLILAYYASFIAAAVQISTILLISLFVQAIFDMDALAAGIRIMPLAAGLTASAALAGHLSSRVSGQIVAASGMTVVAFACLGMFVAIGPTISPLVLTVLMAAIGAGIGLFMTPNTASIMISVPSSRRGIANGLRSTMQNAGFSVGTALSLALITAPLSTLGKHAVYAGRGAELNQHEITMILGQYRIAFFVLAMLAATAAVAAVVRRVKPA